MKFYILTFLIAYLSLLSDGATDFYPDIKATKAIQSTLKDKTISINEKIKITNWLEKEEPFSLYSLNCENQETLYAVFTHSKGRYEYFDYLVLINSNLEITKVKVLKYRSENGGEISSKKWLEQFIGYTTGYLHYKKDISAISGATISAMSISRDIPKVMDVVRANVLPKSN